MTDKTTPETLRDLLSWARTHLAARRLDDADSVLKAAYDLAPTHPYAIHILGLLRHQQQRRSEALDLLRQAEPALGGDPMACFNFATVLLEQGGYVDAVERLHRALAARTNFDDARLQLGVAYSKLGQNEAVTASSTSVPRTWESFCPSTTRCSPEFWPAYRTASCGSWPGPKPR